MGSKDLDPAQRGDVVYPEFDHSMYEQTGVPFDPWKAATSEVWDVKARGLVELGGEIIDDGSIIMPGGSAQHFPDGSSKYYQVLATATTGMREDSTGKIDPETETLQKTNMQYSPSGLIHRTTYNLIGPKPPEEGEPKLVSFSKLKPPKDY